MSHSSTNNNVNVESISNNSSEATLPPSYRTRNNRHHNNISHLRPISAYNESNSNDFSLAMRSSSMENLSRTHHIREQPAPPSNNLSSSPSTSSTSPAERKQPKNVNKCTSINSCSSSNSTNQNQIDSESISDNSDNKKLLKNNNNKDLVTIVTISGFIDEHEGKKKNEENSKKEEITPEIGVLAHL